MQTLGTDSLPRCSPSKGSCRPCPLPVTSTRKLNLPPWQTCCPHGGSRHACGSSRASSGQPPTHCPVPSAALSFQQASSPVSRSQMRPQLVHSQKGPHVLSEIRLQVLGFLAVPPPCPGLLSRLPCLLPSLLSSQLPPFLHILRVTHSSHQQVVSLSQKANPKSTGTPDAPCEQRPCAADASKYAWRDRHQGRPAQNRPQGP